VTDLYRQLNRPLAVGGKTIARRLVLAPLSKVGNLAFRTLVAEYGGCGLLFSEMCGARSAPQGRGTNPLGFMWRKEELPNLVCQIFDRDPETMARAAARVESAGFFGVDLNFGCSVSALCRRGCGAALLKTPRRAAAIVAAVRNAVSFPLFVKFRTGWQDDAEGAVDMARRFEDAGADALTFHPRVAPDRRSRPAKWSVIAMVKSGVAVPVFGNGDVFAPTDCQRMLNTTGCDGVALGRLAIARPWIFAELADGFEPGPEIFRESALRLFRLLIRFYGPEIALRRFHKFSAYFSANFRFGHTLFSTLSRARAPQGVETALKHFFEGAPETVSRPNITLFR
jgi:tRNA-dihydrouridine synthase B